MTELIFDVEPFDVPLKKGVPIKIEKQVAIAAEGMAVVMDMVKGLNVKITFVVDDKFKQIRPDMIKLAIEDGHNVVDKANCGQYIPTKICGVNLSGITIQHIPIDLYRLLVKIASRKKATIVFKVWAFTNALYDSRYRVPAKYYKNCAVALVRRLSLVIVDMNK